ncbi:MAG: DNA-binding protein AsgB [Myxococcaceae bacterium]|nr:DNA-binding protein AsgB [Myxococcaceae bacterium]
MSEQGVHGEPAWGQDVVQDAVDSKSSLAVALHSVGEPIEDGLEGDLEDDVDGRGKRRRRSRARARTISIRRLSKTELNLGRMMYPEEQYWRPESRGECADMERPCPFVSCKYHLYIDVHPVRGSIKINFPDIEVWEMTDTCALDIADRGGITLEEVGEIMNLTRERVRQVETQGLAKLQGLSEVDLLRDYVDE